MTEQTKPTYEELEAEIRRLDRQIEILSDPKLLDLAMEPGGELRMNLEPCVGAKALAASFSDMIGHSPNWASVVVGPMPSDQGMLIVTVRRHTGLEPEAQVKKAKEIIAALLPNLPMHLSPEVQAVVAEAIKFTHPTPPTNQD